MSMLWQSFLTIKEVRISWQEAGASFYRSRQCGKSWILTTPNFSPGDVHALAVSRTATGDKNLCRKQCIGYPSGSSLSVHRRRIYLNIGSALILTPRA